MQTESQQTLSSQIELETHKKLEKYIVGKNTKYTMQVELFTTRNKTNNSENAEPYLHIFLQRRIGFCLNIFKAQVNIKSMRRMSMYGYALTVNIFCAAPKLYVLNYSD